MNEENKTPLQESLDELKKSISKLSTEQLQETLLKMVQSFGKIMSSCVTFQRLNSQLEAALEQERKRRIIAEEQLELLRSELDRG
jgi:hypothetical protein